MPSESRAAAGLLTRPDRTFEVLLHTLPGTRFGLEERWFNVGPFAERLDAQEEFDLLCREFRDDALVVILLVASVHDDATGLYRDRILESRGRAPLIRRDRMASLSAQPSASACWRRPRRTARPPAGRLRADTAARAALAGADAAWGRAGRASSSALLAARLAAMAGLTPRQADMSRD